MVWEHVKGIRRHPDYAIGGLNGLDNLDVFWPNRRIFEEQLPRLHLTPTEHQDPPGHLFEPTKGSATKAGGHELTHQFE
jgi:hypothetical protein